MTGDASVQHLVEATQLPASHTWAFGIHGEPSVKEIVRFTEPGEMMGMTVPQVDYAWQLKNMPEWAKSKPMQEAFTQLARDNAETLEGKAAVVLMNEGWVHEKAMRR